MMRPALLCGIVILLCIPALTVTGRPDREDETIPAVETITVTGMLRLVGNEPFTRFSLRTDAGEDYILEDVVREDWTTNLGRRITVKGLLKVRTMKSADETMTFTENSILEAELQE